MMGCDPALEASLLAVERIEQDDAGQPRAQAVVRKTIRQRQIAAAVGDQHHARALQCSEWRTGDRRQMAEGLVQISRQKAAVPEMAGA